MTSTAARLTDIYARLQKQFGPQFWWPAESPFEVMVGAVLTQNTNWRNVSRAIEILKEHGVLSYEAMSALAEEHLAQLIKPSGYYNIKAKRLKNLLRMIESAYDGDLEALLHDDLPTARKRLLEVRGIGPETADSILLYAAHKPTFVVDAYTYRILTRHSLIPEECDYQTIQDLFMDNLPADPVAFNEYHALLVRTAKEFCRKTKPLCQLCPLHGV